MRCEDYREAASATLDGEPAGMAPTALDAHRADCADCRSWQADVETLTRRARVRGADAAPADLAARVLARATLPDSAIRRRIAVLRWLLGVVGVVQAVVAVPAVFDDDLGMAMSVHASHESAAWNLAVAAALLLVAWRPSRVGGALAAVGTFVVVLTGLSVVDVVAGGVGIERLLSHAAVVVGAGLLLALQRATRGWPDGVPVVPAVADPADETAALQRWSARMTARRRDVA